MQPSPIGKTESLLLPRVRGFACVMAVMGTSLLQVIEDHPRRFRANACCCPKLPPHPEEHRAAMRLEGWATCLVVAHPSRRPLRGLLRVRWFCGSGTRLARNLLIRR